MKWTITEDETWICTYDPETSDQPSKYRPKGESDLKKSA